MRNKLLVICMLFFLSCMTMNIAQAKSDIELEYEYGFNGYVQQEKGFPLKIKVTNNGKDFSGDLVIKVLSGYYVGTSIKVDVDVLGNSEATYTVYLPGLFNDGYSYNNMKPIVTLYEGDFKKGQEVEYSGSKVLAPRYYAKNADIAGTLTSNNERMNFVSKMKGVNYTLPLTKTSFPEDALGLEMFSKIFVDDISLNTLNEKQIDSLNKWVSNGGVLLLSANVATDSILTPLHTNSEVTIDGKFKIENYEFNESMRVFKVDLNNNAEIVTNENGIVVAKSTFGNGVIVQYNFILGDNPLKDWEQYPLWFSANLQNAKISNSVAKFSTSLLANGAEMLNSSTNRFKSISVSLSTISIVLVSYLVIVTMGIYLFLKKKKRLEYAWIVIPAIAIISSVIIFVIGAKDRFLESRLNQLAVYINNDGNVHGIISANLLTNKGGDIELQLDDNTPIYTLSYNSFSSVNDTHNVIVTPGLDKTTAFYKDVNYWSTVNATASLNVEDIGNFDYDLIVENAFLKGTITNNYPYDFEKISIWSESNLYELEGLAAGQSMDVNIKLNSSLLTKPSRYDTNYYPIEDMDLLKFHSLNNFMSYLMEAYKSTNYQKPFILGQTKATIHSFGLVKGKYSVDHVSFIMEPFDAEMVSSGEMVIQSKSMEHELIVLNGKVENMEKDSNWYYIHPGEYEIKYHLPKSLENKQMELIQLQATMYNNDPSIEYYIYQYNTDTYVPLGSQLFVNDKNDTYIQANEMKLKLVKADNVASGDLNLPDLTVKVEVSK